MRKTILENGRDDVIEKRRFQKNADRVSSRNSTSRWRSRSGQEILFGETRVGARRREARRPLLPLRWRLLRPVRVRGSAASSNHTQMAWEVADIESAVASLRARGVVFEEYDLPGLKTVNGIADIEGNYPSKGVGERAAWFKDSEGNLLGLGQPVPR